MKKLSLKRLHSTLSNTVKPTVFKLNCYYLQASSYRDVLETLSAYTRHTFVVPVREDSQRYGLPGNVMAIPYQDLFCTEINYPMLTEYLIEKQNQLKLCAVYASGVKFKPVFNNFDVLFISGPNRNTVEAFASKLHPHVMIDCQMLGLSADIDSLLFTHDKRVSEWKKELLYA